MKKQSKEPSMVNVSVKATPLNIVSAVLLSALALTFIFPSEVEFASGAGRNIVELRGEVSHESMVLLANDIDAKKRNGKTKRLLIKVPISPGGDVISGREVLKRMNTDAVKVDTFSDNFFASMAMSIFLHGDNRIVTKDAIGLIHRGSVGDITYYAVKIKLNEAKAAASLLESKGAHVPLDLLNAIANMESIIGIMDKLFEQDMKALEKAKLTAPKPEKTQAIIDLMKEGRLDVTLSAEEMLEAGIATEIVDSAATLAPRYE